MADFSQNIQNFQRYGTYTYKFDEVGNLIFNSSSVDFSQVYLSFPLVNVVYDNAKLTSFYNPDFVEFVPTDMVTATTTSTTDLQQQLDTVQQENDALKTQLDDLLIQPDNTNTADQQATKQVILELRKAIGQGRVDSDFSDTFPYTAIRKPTT
jgi:hypothetical protein